MLGVSRKLDEHTLQVYPDTRPIKQSMHRFSKPMHKAIGDKINHLLEAMFIWEMKTTT
jgi:hypothetical protein